MDERAVFDRFHEALDAEPRPGAYERLRTELTRQPVALKRRPAFRMRFTKMGLRLTAAVAAVLIAIALIATFVVVHNRPTGMLPATNQATVTAYRTMIRSDYDNMNASTSNHCDTIQDQGCAQAWVPVDAALRKWVDDMGAFPNVPAEFRALNTAMQAHLTQVIADSNAAIVFQAAGDAAGFDLAMKHAFYERSWIDPATFTIEGTYQRVATSNADAVARAKAWVADCTGSTPGPNAIDCKRLDNYQTCDGADAVGCESDVENVETQIEMLLIGMAQNPAPSAKSTRYAQAQSDLARADAGLMTIVEALNHRDASAVNFAETAFAQGMGACDLDLATM